MSVSVNFRNFSLIHHHLSTKGGPFLKTFVKLFKAQWQSFWMPDISRLKVWNRLKPVSTHVSISDRLQLCVGVIVFCETNGIYDEF